MGGLRGVRLVADAKAEEPRATIRIINSHRSIDRNLVVTTVDGHVVRSGSARRIEIHTKDGDAAISLPEPGADGTVELDTRARG